jgi:hypothetical protein
MKRTTAELWRGEKASNGSMTSTPKYNECVENKTPYPGGRAGSFCSSLKKRNAYSNDRYIKEVSEIIPVKRVRWHMGT